MGFLTRSRRFRQVTLLVVSVLTVSTLFGQNVLVEPSPPQVDILIAPLFGQHVPVEPSPPQVADTLIAPVVVAVVASHVNATRSICLTPDCFQKRGSRLARAFPDRPKDSWCIPASRPEENTLRDGKWQGLLLVKVPKAASSTAAGLTLRIANRTGCAVQFEHREGIKYSKRHAESFLFATVRKPHARAFSMAYFFIISPLNITPSDPNIIRSVNTRRGGKTKGKGGYMFNYITLRKIPPKSVWNPSTPRQVQNETLVTEYVQEIVNSYDFLMVVERMDESLTALALVAGLDLGDVLSTSSKVSGAYRLIKGQCSQQSKGHISKGVMDYFESKVWLAMNFADYVLYEAANHSLDLTIERIGRDRFDRALAEFRRLKAKVMQVCGDSQVGLGCTGNDVALPENTCYLRDFGCGHTCVDAMLRDEKSTSK